MTPNPERSKRSGLFEVAGRWKIAGELTLDGSKTNLYVHDPKSFDTHAIPDQYVKGVLHDLIRVSLINCVTAPVPGISSGRGEQYFFANIFPHFVIEGDRHLAPTDKTVTKIHFVMEDATSLFYDFDAFGSLIDATPFIDQIIKANFETFDPSGERLRAIKTTPHAQLLYFTGDREIVATDTVIGKVVVTHNPQSNMGGPEGVWLKNTIVVTIEFEDAVAFESAVSSLGVLLRYFELLVGRPQNLLTVHVGVKSDDDSAATLRVHWSMPPRRDAADEAERGPQPGDILLDAVRRREEFSKVLTNWLDRQSTWGEARTRFAGCFAKQTGYDIDRLVAAANMFDILPNSAVPKAVELSPELKHAKEASRLSFSKLPQSPERDSVLNALGRLGKSVLKHKIRYRAQSIIDAVGKTLPDLTMVTDEAVNCRNHYVHGSDARFDYSDNFGMVIFFTNTLEFVFASSDLIEAGWDIRVWLSHGTTMSHPFGEFCANYVTRLRQLRKLLLATDGVS